MSKVTEQPTTESRKQDHIRINLENDVQFPRVTTGLERYRLLHQALPETEPGRHRHVYMPIRQAAICADCHIFNDGRDRDRAGD